MPQDNDRNGTSDWVGSVRFELAPLCSLLNFEVALQ